MTWWMVDDALYDSPSMEKVSAEALGVHTIMCSYVGRRMFSDDFDGCFTIKRVELVTRIFGRPPTPRKLRTIIAELTEAGMWCDLGEDRYRLVEAPPFGKFSNNPQLRKKRSEAGKAGGKASGRSRRTKAEARASGENEANNEAHASETLWQTDGKTKQPDTLTDTYTDNPPYPPEAAEAGPAPDDPVRHADERTRRLVRDAYPGRRGRRADADRAVDETLADCDARTLYASVVRYSRAVEAGSVLRRDVPSLPEWLHDGQWRRWQPDRPSSYEWGTVTRDWIREHIEQRVPAGAFTADHERDFWASVKTGTSPDEASQAIVDELTRRARRIETMQGEAAQ
ncbi:general stress protein [Bifidobacterium samirii]|uniref:Uncharacterized protein n=1 Tax=Bifidobacterium samirii TaxID=2306974 RepID=A0A430FJD9_9BIFI|nr:hypothetical protein [Bifidobacterium samirii]RSX53004.1 hypothetical protein D2E24_1675 [Bifidobacterium samirii]